MEAYDFVHYTFVGYSWWCTGATCANPAIYRYAVWSL